MAWLKSNEQKTMQINTAAIAQHLNIMESAIVRIEEWANVLFVVCRGFGARFVGKKVVEEKMKEYTDITEYRAALDLLAFSQFAGEEVVTATRVSLPATSPFLPEKQGWQLTTISGKLIDCTDRQKSEIKLLNPCSIKYAGPVYDQFESCQGFYH